MIKKIVGLKDLRDESTDEIRVVIELKIQHILRKILNYLYKHTQLEQNFNFNMVCFGRWCSTNNVAQRHAC